MGLPIPDLDDKRFSKIIEEIIARLPALAPQWTNYNLSDPGITILELLSWLADIEYYRLNRITEKHILKFLKLLNVNPEPVKPAKTWITFFFKSSENSDSAKFLKIDKGTKLITKKDLFFETVNDVCIHSAKIQKIITKNEKGIMEYNNDNSLLYFYPFGKDAKDGNWFRIYFDKYLTTTFSLTFILYEDDLPPVGKHGNETPEIIPSAEIEWSYYNGTNWEKLDCVFDETLSFTKTGSITFIPKKDSKCISLLCKLKKGSYEITPRIKKILLNTVKAIQIKKIEEELGISNGLPNQTFLLKEKSLISSKDFKIKLKVQYSENGNIITDDSWEEVDTLEAYTYKDKVFKVDRNKGLITFGNGINGKIPPSGAIIFCSYAVSKGEEGNIPENSKWQILDHADADKINIINYVPSSGGKNPESIEEAFLRFKKDFITPYQAVTAEDYEFLALNTPGLRVARAKAIADKTSNEVKVIVVPFSFSSKPYPSEGFLKTVCKHLDKHRLITTKIKVLPPQYAIISVFGKIKIKDNADPDQVIKESKKLLNRFFHPLYGWKDGKGWPFGNPVYLSDIYEILENIKGVDCVFDLEIKVDGAYSSYKDGNVILKENALTLSGTHTFEILRTYEYCRR